MIKIVAVGKIKEKALRTQIEEYEKWLRLSLNLCVKKRKYKKLTILNHKNITKYNKSVI